MTQHNDKARCRRRRGASFHPGAPPDSGDVLWEIFLRLPPLPSSLLRVSLVCKRWRRLAADPEFLFRFRAHHRKAPLLGLFSENSGWLAFTPVTKPPDRIPGQRLSMWIGGTYPFHGKLLGCRHGRVLVLNPRGHEVIVHDPITRDQICIALPPEFDTGYIHTYMTEGAVLCADRIQGHVHGGCHASPFKVVLVHILPEKHERRRACAAVYSSETSTWSDLISAPKQCRSTFVDFHRPSTLVGGSLYWWLRSSDNDYMEILGFHIGSKSLSVIKGPPSLKLNIYCSRIIQGEDGGVGIAVLSYFILETWDWKVSFGGGVATWVRRKNVDLQMVPNTRATQTEIVGYVEEEDAILIRFNEYVFIVQLDSTQSNKLCENFRTDRYHPFTSFYSSGSSSVVTSV